MASYIVNDGQSSKVLHKLFCKIINLLWQKVSAFIQWRYVRASLCRYGLRLLSGRMSSGSVPFVKLPHVSNRTHKIKSAFWGKLVCSLIRFLIFHTSYRFQTYRLVYLLSSQLKVLEERRFTCCCRSFPSLFWTGPSTPGSLNPVRQSWRWGGPRDRLIMMLYYSDSSQHHQ